MMPFANLLAVIIILTSAIILLWFISLEIINSRKFMFFLPFFVLSTWLCFSATLNFYEIYDQRVWFVFELFWGILLLWILIILIKKKNV